MLQSPSSIPVANQSSLAFGIAGLSVTGSRNQKHVALIYRDIDGDPWLLHLGSHEDLRHEQWNRQYYWVEFSGLDVEVEENFADWAVLVAGAAQTIPIPYSIILSNDRNFAASGHYIDRKDGSGLTCATFLLAIFADFGMPLLDQVDWPKSRAGDADWALRILNALKDRFELPHYLEQLRKAHILKRFRPEEVLVTAPLYAGVPLHFNVVDPLAKKCLTQLAE